MFSERKERVALLRPAEWINIAIFAYSPSKDLVAGANSVVTKDVAAYSIVAGVPAKIIKQL